MNKKVWLGALVVFIVLEILMFLVDGVILSSPFETSRACSDPTWLRKCGCTMLSTFSTHSFSLSFSQKVTRKRESWKACDTGSTSASGSVSGCHWAQMR